MSRKYAYLIWLLLCMSANAIVFLLFSPRTLSFWISYAFLMFAFIFQVPAFEYSLQPNVKGILGVTTILISTFYLFLQIAGSFWFMSHNNYPVQMVLCVFIVLATVSATSLLILCIGHIEIQKNSRRDHGET